MQPLAIVFFSFVLIAWLAPAIRATRNGKFQLALIGLAMGPAAVGIYMLDRHPNVATGVFVALMVAEGVIWRLAGNTSAK